MTSPNGLLLYRGTSELDGRKIVCIATGLSARSANPKTGAMIQTYILADGNLDPVAARQRGRDYSVCGDCPHRNGTCYVNVTQAPLAVWRALRRGAYPRFDREQHSRLFRGRALRLGAYGDPAAAPLRVWARLCRLVASRTGYTHQWRHCNPRLKRYCMASCDTPEERDLARAMGWRTFRVRVPGGPLLPGEFACPASAEEGKRLTCAECRACHGAGARGLGASPSIVFHGPAIAGGWRLKRFAALQEERRTALALPVLA